ncbi:MAG: archease [Candidatus Eisenbacteria sp.]|nr:archease [Candidatus Eisenbacteria bacterium]
MTVEERREPGGEGFEPVDHTADVALRIWAADLEGLFRQAALGLVSFLTDPEQVSAVERHELRIEGIDLEELLVAWLGELLYRFETEQFLLADCRRLRIERQGTAYLLEATVHGERFDPRRHPGGTEIKAATYHGLRILPGETGAYEVTVVLDT